MIYSLEDSFKLTNLKQKLKEAQQQVKKLNFNNDRELILNNISRLVSEIKAIEGGYVKK